MSVLIKGMAMPKNCYDCPLRKRIGLNIVCPITYEEFPVADVNILFYRLDNCPIIPVPDHGRLIEKKAVYDLIQSMPDVDMNLPVNFMKALYELPTIIPAEEGEG